MAVANSGTEYPDGTVIVFDLLAAEEKDGTYIEGTRKFIGVMSKNRKAYPPQHNGPSAPQTAAATSFGRWPP